MTEVLVDFSHSKQDRQHSLRLDKATRDALADYCRFRWPSNGAKFAAREWDLTLDEGRGVLAARASQTTIDKIIKHKNGGWPVLIPVMGQVIGRGLDQHIIEMRKTHHAHGERLAALAADWLPLGADRGPLHSSDGDALGERRGAVGDRRTGQHRQ